MEPTLPQRQAQLAALVVVALTTMALQCRGLPDKALVAPGVETLELLVVVARHN